MTTAQDTEPRALSLAEIGRRIELNKQSGWGLERGTPSQLNLVALFCQRHGLLPGDDVTLQNGKPWITVDGRVKLMRRNKEYRGFSTRPLDEKEKLAGGWLPDEIVWQATVRTTIYGEITEYGSAKRVGDRNPVAATHPAEMARKRALSRAARLAFGTEGYVDDEQVEEDVRVVVEEQRQPERIANGAKRYDEIFPPDDEPPSRKELSNEGDLVSERSPEAEALRRLKKTAIELDMRLEDYGVGYPAPRELVIRLGERLEDAIDERKRELAREEEDSEPATLL